MSDPDMKAMMALASVMWDAAIFADLNLSSLVGCFMVETSLRYGNAESSCFGYGVFGMVAAHWFDRFAEGDRFARLGLALVERDHVQAYESKVLVCMGDMTLPWVKPYREAIEYLEKGMVAGEEVGDILWAAYSAVCSSKFLLLSGVPLDEFYRETGRHLDFIRKARFFQAADIVVSTRRLAQQLRGLTTSFSTFNGEGFDEVAFEKNISNGDRRLSVLCFASCKVPSSPGLRSSRSCRG